MKNRKTDRVVLQSSYEWLTQTETWIYNHIKYLEGWRAVVLCEKTLNLDQFPWPEIYSAESESLVERKIRGLKRRLGATTFPTPFERAARRTKARLLHSHFGPQGWRNLGFADKYGLRTIVTFYGYDVKRIFTEQPIWRERYQEMFARIDLVLCEGPYMAGSIADIGCPKEKVRVQRLGVDLSRFPYKPRIWDGSSPLRLLMAARFMEKKGFPYAIEAIGLLHRLKPEIQMEITIIGDAYQELADSLVEKEAILRRVGEWGLSGRVRLLGLQPYSRVIEEAYKHHLFLSPSVTASDGDVEGGAPVVLIEMAASGMPIAATKHCDIPGVLGSANRGLLVEEKNPSQLAETLSKLIESRGQWEALVRENREHIERNFDLREQSRSLSRIYDEMVSR